MPSWTSSRITRDLGCPKYPGKVTIAPIGDLDGDGVLEIAFASEQAPDSSSAIQVRSGMTGELMLRTGSIGGGRVQLGKSLCRVSDYDADGIDDIAASADAAEGVGGGSILVFSSGSGELLHEVRSPGTGSFADSLSEHAGGIAFGSVGWPDERGSVARADAKTGEILWVAVGRSGDDSCALGSTLLLAPDIDGDGVPELLAAAGQENVFPRPPTSFVRLISGATGEMVWEYTSPRMDWYSGFGDAMCFVADMDCDGLEDIALAEFLYFVSLRGRVSFLSSSSGELVSTRELDALVGSSIAADPIGGTSLYLGGYLYISGGVPEGKGRLVALDPHSDRLRWELAGDRLGLKD